MFACYCGTSGFPSASWLRQHQIDNKHGHCKSCWLFFDSASALETHRLTAHSYRCSSCPRILQTLEALEQHQSGQHFSCSDCKQIFANKDELNKHIHSSNHLCCPTCKRSFEYTSALQTHQKAKRHCFCHFCQLYFSTEAAFDEHISALHKFRCQSCGEIFASKALLKSHQKQTGHLYCSDCEEIFSAQNALDEHLRSAIHDTDFRCCDCNKYFADELALNQHLRDKIHVAAKKKPSPTKGLQTGEWVCEQCDREFCDETALLQHRNSLIHQPLGDIQCVGGKRCRKRFSSPSAMINHLESGACSSGLTRQKLNKLVLAHDVKKLISGNIPQQKDVHLPSGDCITETFSDTSSTTGGVPIYTPNTITSSGHLQGLASLSSGLLTPTSSSHVASPFTNTHALTRDGRYMCPQCSKTFRDFSALHSHISSPVHSARIFHCPTAFLAPEMSPHDTTKSTKFFSTLSGLTLHLESKACVGGKEGLHTAIGFVEAYLKLVGWSEWRLLA